MTTNIQEVLNQNYLAEKAKFQIFNPLSPYGSSYVSSIVIFVNNDGLALLYKDLQ